MHKMPPTAGTSFSRVKQSKEASQILQFTSQHGMKVADALQSTAASQ